MNARHCKNHRRPTSCARDGGGRGDRVRWREPRRAGSCSMTPSIPAQRVASGRLSLSFGAVGRHRRRGRAAARAHRERPVRERRRRPPAALRAHAVQLRAGADRGDRRDLDRHPVLRADRRLGVRRSAERLRAAAERLCSGGRAVPGHRQHTAHVARDRPRRVAVRATARRAGATGRRADAAHQRGGERAAVPGRSQPGHRGRRRARARRYRRAAVGPVGRSAGGAVALDRPGLDRRLHRSRRPRPASAAAASEHRSSGDGPARARWPASRAAHVRPRIRCRELSR